MIRYYERAGFTRADRFTLPHVLDRWEGQVLVRRVTSMETGDGRWPTATTRDEEPFDRRVPGLVRGGRIGGAAP
jgi:hypothetical protein